MPRSPLETARILASHYGHTLEPTNYVRGVGISGRLRLAEIDPDTQDPSSEISDLVAPSITDEAFETNSQSDGSVHSGFVWASDLSRSTKDDRYITNLIRYSDLYLATRPDGFPEPVDPDYRVEDVFFVGAVLGRAFEATSDSRYSDALIAVMQKVHAQPDTGLWHHCGQSPYYWGRGNGFAALGFAEALTYLNQDQEGVSELTQKHVAHLQALLPHQEVGGAWRQVIDEPETYLELTCTAMIGYALARGRRMGWLDGRFDDPLTRAWDAVSSRVNAQGMVAHSCTGTGPLNSLGEYRIRKQENGYDDRGGSLALWFAVESIKR
ncbi:MAG: glycoside hydrolase family 88 protein [Chloroflexi bacterium]|nr:glycoside hydrolase family 88 protein [Chloroflexota bacterium]